MIALPCRARDFRVHRGVVFALAIAGAASYLIELVWVAPALAADSSEETELKEIAAQLRSQEKRLANQERLLRAQQDAIARQAALIERQRDELDRLRTHGVREATVQPSNPAPVVMGPAPGSVAPQVGTAGGQQTAGVQVSQNTSMASASPPAATVSAPASPVGEAPKQEQAPQVVESLPQGLAILTPPGHFILMPSFEYTQTTNDRLVYEGVVIVPGINLGEVEASTDDIGIFSTVFDARYGLTKNMEVELRVPLTYAEDRATLLSQGPSGSATQSVYIKGKGLADVELAGRYQLNSGLDDWPIFVVNARVKSDTGMGPYDIERNKAGIAEQVAIGSGFWAAEGGFSVLKVTDPAVLFASANYVYSLPRDIDKTIGNVFVGRVDPSNSVSLTLGFGFAVNPDFSFSLGYNHSYVFPQYSELGGTPQQTTSLEVGALTLGTSYRLNDTTLFNTNFQFGVTHDAPNLYAVFSVPVNY